MLAACGEVVTAVELPGHPEADRARRCPPCCAAAGYPDGLGSPVGDDGCAPRLRERLAGAGPMLAR